MVKAASLPEAPVAQLDRASDYESEGRTFESFRARHHHTMRLENQAMTKSDLADECKRLVADMLAGLRRLWDA